MLHNNSGSFFQKKNQSLELNWSVITTLFSAHANKVFFSLYIFWSHQYLANPTHPPCHQTSSFGHPTHPALWWHNTWMVPYLQFCEQKYQNPSTVQPGSIRESSCQSITLFGVNFGHGLVSWGHDKVLLTAYKLTTVLVTILRLENFTITTFEMTTKH